MCRSQGREAFCRARRKDSSRHGGGRLPDGPLLKLAEGAFDVLITIDRSLEYQQNLRKLSLGVVVVDVPKNQMPYYVAVARDLLSAVNRLRPGQVIHV